MRFIESTFAQIGGDSLDVVEIAMEIEDQLETSIDDERLEKFKTVGEVIDFVQDQCRDEGTISED